MADGKCDKCGTATTNQGNLFRTGSGMVSYQSKGKKTIQTTTVTGTQQCVLCND